MAMVKLPSLLLAWQLVPLVFAQAPKDPTQDVCRRFGHQTAVIDKKLYIDGGWLYASPMDQNPQPTMSETLIYGDLSLTDQGMPELHAGLAKNNTVPNVAGGILWADDVNKVFWLYGGEYDNVPSAFELWGYDTILNQWNMSTAPEQATSTIQRVSYGAGTTLDRLGFYYGGYLNQRTNPRWNGPPIATTGLIRFDMNNSRLDNMTGPDNIGRAEGVMLSVPASAAGLLVYFGGVTFPYGNTTEVPMPMSNIMIYDIGDNRWYTQTATGEIPANRRKFCAGATWANDQSSYNIYLYGGAGFGQNITGFDDVYILSLPTFEWVKWYPDVPGTPFPKYGLTCNVIDRGQMLVIGGNYTNQTNQVCDVPTIGGQHNMNLGQLDATNAKWYQFLPNLTDYAVPVDILSVTGGTSTGGADNKAPANGWSNPNLGVYFAAKAQFQSRTPTRYIPQATTSATSTPTPVSSNTKSKTPIGAIVGGVVGGVVVLVLIAALAWCCLKRRKAPKSDPPAEPSHSRPSMSTVNELTSDNNRETKNAMVVGSPSSAGYYSPPQTHSPYTTPPPMHTDHQMPYLHPGQTFSQHHNMVQPQQTYGYPQYLPGSTSPAAMMYPQQQQQQQPYFPPPDNTRTSPKPTQAHEMPIASTPGIHHVVYQPTPQRLERIDDAPSLSQHSRSDRYSRGT